jgi:hypothetical protein
MRSWATVLLHAAREQVSSLAFWKCQQNIQKITIQTPRKALKEREPMFCCSPLYIYECINICNKFSKIIMWSSLIWPIQQCTPLRQKAAKQHIFCSCQMLIALCSYKKANKLTKSDVPPLWCVMARTSK